jgi:hypothetical protein
MVRVRYTRDGRRFSIGLGRFEMRNTLLPGVDLLCGGLQGKSHVWKKLVSWVGGRLK